MTALPWVLGWYALASLIALALYAIDKRRARRGRWRIPESRLHLAELLGGWPGGLLARSLVRHKTQKRRFLAISWAIVALHALGWLALLLLLRG